MNQRWRLRIASYRAPLEQIQTSAYEVAAIPDDNTAAAFVERHHYSGSFPAARFRFGLYRGGELEGVAVFSHPCNNKVLTNAFPRFELLESVELGRFVLLDGVKGNGETWFLARCFEQLRGEGLRGVVSFSDPHPRTDEHGAQVFPGHMGTIYQAHNAVYLGRQARHTIKLFADGRSFDNRTRAKIRGGERGVRGAVAQLQRYGAPELEGDPVEWLRVWSEKILRNHRHPGKHRYAWALAKRDRRHIAAPAVPLPYPKRAA